VSSKTETLIHYLCERAWLIRETLLGIKRFSVWSNEKHNPQESTFFRESFPGADTGCEKRGFEIRTDVPGLLLGDPGHTPLDVFLKSRSGKWDFRHSKAKLACDNVSFFKFKPPPPLPLDRPGPSFLPKSTSDS